MGELWKLLDSAQNNESGIPQEMIDKKKEEIKNRTLKRGGQKREKKESQRRDQKRIP